MCESLLAAVERRADGRRVNAARVQVGTGHRLDPEAFRFAFSLLAEGTVAEGATLDIVTIPAEATCRRCGAVGEPADHLALCAACGSADVEVRGGDHLVLESIVLAGAVPTDGST